MGCDAVCPQRQFDLQPSMLHETFVQASLVSDPTDQTNADDDCDADETPVTVWLRQLEAGDAQAALPLYQHFCTRLQALARQRIPTNIRSVYDQDDASVSAFHSLFLGVREQRYQFHGRTDFWRLLLTIAERKITRRIRHETRDKRDVRRVVQDSIMLRVPDAAPNNDQPTVERLTGREPTPEFAAEVSDTCDALLASLPDDLSRRVALLKLEDHTADAIAAKLGCSRRTVQRKLLVIRRTWQHVGGIEPETKDMSQFGDNQA